MTPKWTLGTDQFEALRERLADVDFTFEDRPHQAFLARRPGISVNVYTTGKITLAGSDGASMREVEAILEELGGFRAPGSRPPPDVLAATGTRIGTDESGKGDYFGPLVVAGVLVTEETEGRLKALGVRDSKKLKADRVAALAPQIRALVGPDAFDEVVIGPKRYNELYDPVQGVGGLLGWAHARAIENLLERNPGCQVAVADQFGDERAIKQALMRKGRQVRLLQSPNGERELAVAAASVLARDRFVRGLEAMGRKWGVEFPKGATHVQEVALAYARQHGEDSLGDVAKLHFRTTGMVFAELRKGTGTPS